MNKGFYELIDKNIPTAICIVTKDHIQNNYNNQNNNNSNNQ